jgi:hypothetical protein
MRDGITVRWKYSCSGVICRNALLRSRLGVAGIESRSHLAAIAGAAPAYRARRPALQAHANRETEFLSMKVEFSEDIQRNKALAEIA